MRILIIEDHEELATTMKEGLNKIGYSVDIVFCGEAGIDKAFVNEYDVILLDLNLPDIDGLQVLEVIRATQKQIPIIIVTAKDEVSDRVRGLDLGADDYITKPFQIKELRARIQAIIRRFHGRVNPNIIIGKLEIHPSSRKVFYNQEEIILRIKEYDILEYIAEKHPQVISAEEIAEHIYDDSYNPFSSVLRVHIAYLKKTLFNINQEELLVTIRGKGYSLCIKED